MVALEKSFTLSLDPVHWYGEGIIKQNQVLGKNGYKSLLWIPQKRGCYLKTKYVPINWSIYNRIELEIYSTKNTDSWINIIIADKHNQLANSFFLVNWKDWKTITFSFNQLFSSFSSFQLDFKNISYLAFESHSSALLNIDETELSIKKISLENFQQKKQPIKELNPVFQKKSLLFPLESIHQWKEIYESKNNPLIQQAFSCISEGNKRLLFNQKPSLEDILDGILWSKWFGDEKILQKSIQQLSLIKEDYWNKLLSSNELLIQNSLITYCLCLDLLKGESAFRPDIEKECLRSLLYAADLEKKIVEYWIRFYPFGMGNNHATRAAAALGIASFFNPNPDRFLMFELSIETLEHFFAFQITEEGVLNEGSHYYLFLMEILTYFNHFLVANNQQNLFTDFSFSNKLSAMVDWSIQIRNPRGYLPSIDDSWQNMVNFPSRFLTPFLPNKNLLCWNSQVNDSTNVLGESWNIIKPFYIPLLLLSLNTYEKPLEPTSTLCSAFYNDSQIVFRDSWTNHANYLFFCGKKLSSLHEHDDTGNIQVEAFGVPILLESGYGPSGWTSSNRKYYVSGQAHNTLLVNGTGPVSYYNGSVGPVDNSSIQDFYHFASFSFANQAVSLHVLHKNTQYNRSVMFLPQYASFPFYTLVLDSIKSGEEKSLQVLFHPNGSLVSSTQSQTKFVIKDEKNIPITIDLFPLEPCQSKIQKGFYSPYWDSEKSTQYISFEKKTTEAIFTSLIIPTRDKAYTIESDTNQKGVSREYKIQFSSQNNQFQDYYNINPYGEIRQMKNQGTNATFSFDRRVGKEEAMETLFLKNGSFVNHKQKSVFFSSSKMNFLYLAKKRELYRYFCQFDAKTESSRTFFRIVDFEKLFLDNQVKEFERTKEGIFVALPSGKHTLTFH